MRLYWRALLPGLCLALGLSWVSSSIAPVGATAPRSLRLVYTQHVNVYQLDTASGHSRPLTTRGGHGDIYYPWYAWSPDGRYLLLVRGHITTTAEDLLLMDRDGTLLRTLASPATASIFRPSWASDADLVAYVASATPSASVPGSIDHLQSLDPLGRRAPLWSFGEPMGCGGGTSDPSEQLQWGETGFGDLAMTFYWSTARHLAVYTNSLCAGAVDVTNTSTGATRQLGRHPHLWHEAVVSVSGTVAALIVSGRNRTVVLTDLRPGAPVRTIASGELPLWSRDGRVLYFVRRTPGSVLHMHDSFGNGTDSQTYTSAVWRCNANGSGLRRLATLDAFGLGPLQLTPDGRALVFARIDNSWALWRHRLAGDRITPALVARYGPRVAVVRLGLDGAVATLVADAHLPAVQP